MKTMIILFLLSIAFLTFGDSGSIGKSAGKEIADVFKNSSNTRDALQNPLLGKGKMTTLGTSYQCDNKSDIYDDSFVCEKRCGKPCSLTSFDPSLQCTVSVSAIEISPRSILSGGEVSLLFSFDTDLDGKIDKELTTPNISGFCTNGFMSCTPGTLDLCKYYEFSVPNKCSDGTTHNSFNSCMQNCQSGCSPVQKYPGFYESDSKSAGRCDCSNSACDKSFNKVFDIFLAKIGSAVASHTAAAAGLTVTESHLDSNILKLSYMASSFDKCHPENAPQIKKAKQGYSSSTGSTDYYSELDKEQSNSDSVYSILTSNTSFSEKNCVVINSVLNPIFGIDVIKSSDTCNDISKCTLTEEEICEAVCPAGSIYNPVRSTCEIPGVKIKKSCPEGYIPIKLDGYSGYIYNEADLALKCGKVIHESSARNKFSGEIVLDSIYSEIRDGDNVWANAQLLASLIRVEDHNGRRTCTNDTKTNASINNTKLGRDKIIRSAWTFVNQEVYRSKPYNITSNGSITYSWNQHLQTCGHSSGSPLHKMKLWHITDIYLNKCPSGFSPAYNRICSKPAKEIGRLECVKSIKSGQKTNIEKTFCSNIVSAAGIVCANGTKFNLTSNRGTFSTNKNSGKFTIKQRHSCKESKKDIDYSDIESGRKGIDINASNTDITVTYTDDKGNTRVITTDGFEEHKEEIYACKISAPDPAETAQVTQEGNVVSNNNEHFEYRKCVDGNCPYNSETEKIIRECHKQSDFAKAVSIMNVLSEASKDITCTE